MDTILDGKFTVIPVALPTTRYGGIRELKLLENGTNFLGKRMTLHQRLNEVAGKHGFKIIHHKVRGSWVVEFVLESNKSLETFRAHISRDTPLPLTEDVIVEAVELELKRRFE